MITALAKNPLVKEKVEAYVTALRDTYGDGYYVDAYGSKYAKVCHGNSVHTFVELNTGDILKAATFRAPAKNGVRGSVYADDHGLSVVGQYGANYLR